MTDLDSEYVFYCAGALIANAYSADHFNLWLLDFSNKQKLAAWYAGAPIPPAECVEVNCAYTVATPGRNNEIHVANSALLRLTTLQDMARGVTVPARVAVSAALWDRIPIADRPLPPKREQDYRIRVVVRRDPDGILREYLGFHVKVIDHEGSHTRVQFYSWTDEPLGAPLLDLATSDFDPVDRRHSTIDSRSRAGDEGALFVSFEYIYLCGFLVVPKVPYGAHGIDVIGSLRPRKPAPSSERLPTTIMPGAERLAAPSELGAPAATRDHVGSPAPWCSHRGCPNHHATTTHPSNRQFLARGA